MFESLSRVRGPTQIMGEFFQKCSCGSQFLLGAFGLNFSPVTIMHIKPVLYAMFVDFDLGLHDVNVSHRQGIGKGVEESRRVRRLNIQDRFRGGIRVGKGDMNRVDQIDGLFVEFPKGFHEAPIDLTPGLSDGIFL